MTQELVIGLAERMQAKRKRAGVGPRRKRARAGRFKGRVSISELKFHDLDIDDAVVAAGGNIAEDSCLTIAQGTTESERIGRKLTVHGINWRFKIAIPATTTPGDSADVIRVMLYLDKQTNGATAAVLDIVETADYQSFNNLSNKSRFRILMDRTYSINAQSGRDTTIGESIITDTLFKKVNIGVEYDNVASTGVITTMRSNNIGVLLLGFSGLAGFSSKMRIRFSDT